MLEYLIVAMIVAWAGYYVWKSFRPQKGGCSCGGSCGEGTSQGNCCSPGQVKKGRCGIQRELSAAAPARGKNN